MNAIDADAAGVIRVPQIRQRRMAICSAILQVGNGTEPRLDAIVERVVGPGSVLAGLFAGGAGGIDPHFVLANIQQAKESFRAGRLRCGAIANLRILCGMTRREGFLARALAAELISP
jgi:hypothetical protein